MALQTRDREFRHPRISYLDFSCSRWTGSHLISGACMAQRLPKPYLAISNSQSKIS